MSWAVTVAGTVHSDDITTPLGHSPDQLGGSAVYFALAASALVTVHLCAIVGDDRATEFNALLDRPGIDTTGLVVSTLPTFVWHARHDFERWVAVDSHSEEGCDNAWEPHLPPAAAAAEVLFLASMRPALQASVLAQSEARLIGVDSMTDYTGPEADGVRSVVLASDILFLNRSELASLTGSAPTDWVDAARALLGGARLRAVVVKAGPLGAACVTTSQVIERDAVAVAEVVDPTGAGDALAGGFLGTCAAAQREDEAFFATALEAGMRRAAMAISRFGTSGLSAAD